MKKLKTIFHILDASKLFSYLKASILNTLLGASNLWLIFYLTKNYFITIFLATFIGYFYSILNFNRIGFKRKGQRPPYKRFAVAYSITFTLNYCLTLILIPIIKDFYLVQLIVVPLVAIIQWLILNLWTFSEKIRWIFFNLIFYLYNQEFFFNLKMIKKNKQENNLSNVWNYE